jgi:anion-transporting  ArsA/GET3 family ATPase
MGPIKSQADSETALFHSDRTAVHLVTVLEEMPVQETTDGIVELRKHGLPVGGVVVNQVRPRDLDEQDLRAVRAGKVTKRKVAADLSRGGITGKADLVTGLLTEGRDHAERRALEDAQRALVEELDVPTYELPLLVGGVDLGGLYELAGLLRDQGLA